MGPVDPAVAQSGSDSMLRKTNLFGLDELVNMATAAGLRVELRVRDAA